MAETISIRAGEFRHQVIIQSRATGKDARGQANGAWSNVSTVSASIETISGRESEVANKLFPEASLRVVMRYFSGLTPEHRMKFGSRVFSIGHIDNVQERNVKHVILCAEDR